MASTGSKVFSHHKHRTKPQQSDMKMVISTHSGLALLSALILAINHLACATDPDMLQDYCPAIPDYGYKNGHKNMVSVNGKFCKDPKTVTSGDFKCSGIEKVFPGSRNFKSLMYDIDSCPGVNTLGISSGIGYYDLGGYLPLHFHPRGSELEIVKKGKIFTGFITSTSSGSKFFGNLLGPGDSMVVPEGMLHFNVNAGNVPAELLVAFPSQNPGDTVINEYSLLKSANSSSVDIDSLAKAYSLNDEAVDLIKKSLADLGN